MTEETDVLKDRRNKCFKFDAFNLNYNPFFKEIITNIYNISTSVINSCAKFNLTSKSSYLVKNNDLPPI